MNKKQIAITLGIMCFILTIGISIQIKTMNQASSTASQSLIDNNLRDEVLRWKERYDNISGQLENAENELEQIRQVATRNDTTSQAKQEALNKNNTLLGLTEVKGDGIVIELQDGTLAETDSLLIIENANKMIIHNSDLLALVNELNNAGAEAIEINGQRIVNTSSITCEGNVIKVNGEKIGSPFVIKAIGSQGLLYGQITRIGSYMDLLINDGAIVNVRKEDDITIGKYTGIITFKYTKTVEDR